MEVRAVTEGTAVGWYKVTMTSREYKAKGKDLEDSFETQFEQHGSLEGAALFVRKDEKAATWEYYLTPEAVAFSQSLLKEFVWGQEYAWGQPCAAPAATVRNLSFCKGSTGNKYAHLMEPSK
jgi:hypothetical protein